MMQKNIQSLIGRALVLSALCLFAVGASATPYKNFWITVKVVQPGAGVVYASSDDKVTDKEKDNYDNSKSKEDQEVDYKFTTGESKENEVPYYYAYLHARANEGWKFRGFVKELKDNYEEKDFVGTLTENETIGEFGYKVDVNHPNSDGTVTERKTEDNNHFEVHNKTNTDDEIWWPTASEQTFYAIFQKSVGRFSTVAYYEGGWEGADNQNDKFGTLSISPEANSEGDAITLTANPQPGFRFVAWKDSDGKVLSTESTWSTTATESKYIGEFDLESITLPAGGMGTYSTMSKLNFGESEGLSGYIVTNVGDNVLTTKEVSQVPAEVGVIVTGAGNATVNPSYKGVVWTTEQQGNQLKSTANGEVQSDGTIYVLANGTQGVGFYKLKSGDSVPRGKAYLQLEENANARAFIGFDTTTGLGQQLLREELERTDAPIYNMSGQRVGMDYRGLVIQNGKKYFKK